MQYGAEVFPYQRTKKKNREKNERKSMDRELIVKMSACLACSFLISRVVLINSWAPFGIAFLMVIAMQGDDKLSIATGCGTLLGYVTLCYFNKNVEAYLILAGTVVGMSYLFSKAKKQVKLALCYFILFIEMILFKRFTSGLALTTSAYTSFFETLIILPIYYMMNYSIVCFKNLKSRHLFTSEEIVGMAITCSLVIAGTRGITIRNVSVVNILSLIFVILMGYVKGSNVGAATGIVIGAVVGISSSEIILFVGVFGLCGLITGAFRESGKWISAASFIMLFVILKVYSNLGNQFKIIEAAIACTAFVAIPSKVCEKIALEIDWDKKERRIMKTYSERTKEVLSKRLWDFREVLNTMCGVLNDMAENDKLAMKNKSTALIDNLADRVCSGCTMNSICWKRESYHTYTAFGELIQNYQDKKRTMPREIERKCIRRSMLERQTEDLINKFIINEMWKNRLDECRGTLATQIDNIACTVEEIVDEFKSDLNVSPEIEDDIVRALSKNKVIYQDVFCYNDKSGRLKTRLSMKACGGKQECVKTILPIINNVTGKCMCIAEDGCNINRDNKTCSVTFEEVPKYHIATYASNCCKDGEKYNGDSYDFDDTGDGTYISVISDGMGSGQVAGKESNAAVELIDKCMKAGFDKFWAINAVNSIMSIKFSEDEKFSTLDLTAIDLYEGNVEFMKVGAVASFIKRGNEVEVVTSKTLPIGVLDKVDVDVIKRQVDNGDVIVMVSDGILDYDSSVAGKVEWLEDYLREIKTNNPKEICDMIINKAKELSSGKVKDDMTVLVNKVYSLY